jgi:hypothetical protein
VKTEEVSQVDFAVIVEMVMTVVVAVVVVADVVAVVVDAMTRRKAGLLALSSDVWYGTTRSSLSKRFTCFLSQSRRLKSLIISVLR